MNQLVSKQQLITLQNIVLPLPNSKQIRSIAYIKKSNSFALMSLLEVFIIQVNTGFVLTVIKRMSPPKSITPIHNYLLMHYSDNYCILYDSMSFEQIYTIFGISTDHKGIKSSKDGRYLLYGNDSALQLWNIRKCQIQLVSQTLKSSCYNISNDGAAIFLGTYNGELHIVHSLLMETNMRVIYSTSRQKIHSQCIIAMQIIDDQLIATLDYSLQCCITNIRTGIKKKLSLRNDQRVVPIVKPISFLFSQKTNKFYLDFNSSLYIIDYLTNNNYFQESKGSLFVFQFNQYVCRLDILQKENKMVISFI